MPGADPGFPIRGGANPVGGSTNLRLCQNFPKKLDEIENILGYGGSKRGTPLRSATGMAILDVSSVPIFHFMANFSFFGHIRGCENFTFNSCEKGP